MLLLQDKGGYSATKQVALNVDDERDSPPVWMKTEPLVKINEELPQVSFLAQTQATSINLK